MYIYIYIYSFVVFFVFVVVVSWCPSARPCPILRKTTQSCPILKISRPILPDPEFPIEGATEGFVWSPPLGGRCCCFWKSAARFCPILKCLARSCASLPDPTSWEFFSVKIVFFNVLFVFFVLVIDSLYLLAMSIRKDKQRVFE